MDDRRKAPAQGEQPARQDEDDEREMEDEDEIRQTAVEHSPLRPAEPFAGMQPQYAPPPPMGGFGAGGAERRSSSRFRLASSRFSFSFARHCWQGATLESWQTDWQAWGTKVLAQAETSGSSVTRRAREKSVSRFDPMDRPPED
jgi:hypothetical protein